MPPRKWLVDGLWPEMAIGFIGGPPKAGKTWFALDTAIALATRADVLGYEARARGPILYFLGEDHLVDALDRLDLLLRGRGMTRRDLGSNLFMTDVVPNIESPAERSELKVEVPGRR